MPKVCLSNSILFLLAVIMVSCGSSDDEPQLPVLGPMSLENRADGGTDTLFHPFPWFAFEDQYGAILNPDSLHGQILLVDFFFSTCPTICKDLTASMAAVHKAFGTDGRLRLISHSVDPSYDTREVLAAYAQKAGVQNRNWLFVRGEQEEMYNLAKQAYLSYVSEDSSAPGGFLHSGHLILLDQTKRIRGVYDGTNTEEVQQLITDIPKLLP